MNKKSPLNFQLPANPGNLNMTSTSVNPNGRNYGAFSFLPSTMARAGMQVAGNPGISSLFTTNRNNNTKPGFGRFSEIFGRPSIFDQPQIGTAQQIAAFNARQDPNNASATGFGNAPAEATAPTQTSSVPITTGGMSPQTQGVAEGVFGDTLSRQRIMDPNRTPQPQGLISF